MSREELKRYMRGYIREKFDIVETRLASYNGRDRDIHMKNFEKCKGLLEDPQKVLNSKSLTKLMQYAELAQKKLQ